MPRPKVFKEEEVLNKAMELFWKKGFHATSIQDLVSHLGINRASLYNAYGSKEGLFRQAFQHYQHINSQRISGFLNNHPDVKQGLYQLFEYTINESLSDQDRKGCFVVNTTTELIPDSEFMKPVLEDNRKRYEQLFYEYLKQGEEKDQILPGKDLYAISALLFTLYNGLQVIVKISDNKEHLLGTIRAALTVLD